MNDSPELRDKIHSLYDHVFKKKLPDNTDKQAQPDQPPENRTIKNTTGIQRGTEIPGFKRVGDYTYLREYAEPNPWQNFSPEPVLATTYTPPSSLVFFDTETTGLSGGAGTIIFLIGIARIEQNQLCIDQFFLSDFPGEAEFLEIIEKKLPDDAVYVSYNGKAFDSHLLYGRYLMHGQQKLLAKQYDLLFPCRRLWKDKIGSCTLKNVEAQVLGIPRENDIDGFEVPERYFNFLRTGNHKLLESVFHHNYLDVFSLAKIHFLIESLIAKPESARNANSSALAKMLFEHNGKKAEDFLSAAFQNGDCISGQTLALKYKQEKNYEKAHELWKKIFKLKKSILSGLEMAKHLEHRKRDNEQAKDIVDQILKSGMPMDYLLRSQLIYRYERLERKIKNKDSTISNI